LDRRLLSGLFGVAALAGSILADGGWSKSAAQERLPAPQNFLVEAAGGGFTASWDAVSGASGYEIHATDPADADDVRVFEIDDPEETTASVTGLGTGLKTDGTRYFISIFAVDSSDRPGNSVTFPRVIRPLPVVGTVDDIDFETTKTSFTASWDPVDNANAYDVAWKEENDDSPTDNTSTITATSVAASDLVPGGSYTLRVEAHNTDTGVRGGTSFTRITLTPAELVIPTLSVTVDEGSTTTFTVKLEAEPTDEVMIAISGEGNGITVRSEAGTRNLRFDDSNWDTPQNVTATAAEDDNGLDESAIVTFRARGGNFEASRLSVTVTARDNDRALEVTPASVTVGENGGTGSFAVQLSHQPAGDVSVTVTSGNTEVATVSPSSLAFSESTGTPPSR